MIHQSKMSGKLEEMYAINTNTLTNEFCIKQHKAKGGKNICAKCYSFKMLGTYRKNAVPALQRNSDLLSSRILTYEEIVAFKPKGKLGIYRFDGHGELINGNHLKNCMMIAEYHPEFVFGMWSKRKKLVQEYVSEYGKPDNMVLVYSNPVIDQVMSTPPEYFDKVFNNVSKEYVPTWPLAMRAWRNGKPWENCTGQRCKDCKLCYVSDETIIVEKVK